jgi:dTDP-4-dehydrorhamnose reductase
MQLNAAVADHLAKAASAIGAIEVQIATDLVFNGLLGSCDCGSKI